MYGLRLDYVNMLDRPVAHFIDTRLLGIASEEITRIRMQGAATGTWELERADDGFAFTFPEGLVKHSVNQKVVDLFVHTLSNGAVSCESTELLVGAVADFSISVWQQGAAEPTTLVVFKKDPETGMYRAKDSRQPTPVEISSKLVDQLTVTAFQLQERPIIDVNVGEAVTQGTCTD